MSLVVKQSQSNTWFLAAVVIVVAIVCHLRNPYSFTGAPPAPQQQQPTVSRDEVRRADLEAAVSGAIGIDKSRGDSVSVILVDREK